jgi:hypothetical protein
MKRQRERTNSRTTAVVGLLLTLAGASGAQAQKPVVRTRPPVGLQGGVNQQKIIVFKGAPSVRVPFRRGLVNRPRSSMVQGAPTDAAALTSMRSTALSTAGLTARPSGSFAVLNAHSLNNEGRARLIIDRPVFLTSGEIDLDSRSSGVLLVLNPESPTGQYLLDCRVRVPAGAEGYSARVSSNWGTQSVNLQATDDWQSVLVAVIPQSLGIGHWEFRLEIVLPARDRIREEDWFWGLGQVEVTRLN